MQPRSPLAKPSFAAVKVRRRAVISLTPLIDVVFILLVFFMLASSFLDWRYVTMDTPAVQATPVADDAPVLTLMVSRAEIRVEGRPLSATEAIAKSKDHLERHPGVAVRLQPAGDTPLQRVMDVLDRLSSAGLGPLTLVRDPAWQDDAEAY